MEHDEAALFPSVVKLGFFFCFCFENQLVNMGEKRIVLFLLLFDVHGIWNMFSPPATRDVLVAQAIRYNAECITSSCFEVSM